MLRCLPHRYTNAALLAISVTLLVLSIVFEGDSLTTLFCAVCVLLYGVLYTPYDGIELIFRTMRSRFSVVTNVLLFGAFLVFAVLHAALDQNSLIAWLAVPPMSWAVWRMTCEMLYVITGHDGMLRRFGLVQ